MSNNVRYTKTFTEIQRSVPGGGQWVSIRVSDVSVDDQINAWVHSTKNVIMDIFSSVEHASLPSTDGVAQYHTKIRYIVTYMEQADYTSTQSPAIRKIPNLMDTNLDKLSVVPDPTTKPAIPFEVPVPRGVPVAPAEEPTNVNTDEEEVSPWREEGASPTTAKAEAEALVRDLKNAVETGKLPPSRAALTKKAIDNPTPPLMVDEKLLQTARKPGELPGRPQAQAQVDPLSRIPSRRTI